jgi:hypothetical protein
MNTYGILIETINLINLEINKFSLKNNNKDR